MVGAPEWREREKNNRIIKKIAFKFHWKEDIALLHRLWSSAGLDGDSQPISDRGHSGIFAVWVEGHWSEAEPRDGTGLVVKCACSPTNTGWCSDLAPNNSYILLSYHRILLLTVWEAFWAFRRHKAIKVQSSIWCSLFDPWTLPWINQEWMRQTWGNP